MNRNWRVCTREGTPDGDTLVDVEGIGVFAVHGDFHDLNLLWSAARPSRITAVLDWDRLRLGPLAAEVVRTATLVFGYDGVSIATPSPRPSPRLGIGLRPIPSRVPWPTCPGALSVNSTRPTFPVLSLSVSSSSRGAATEHLTVDAIMTAVPPKRLPLVDTARKPPVEAWEFRITPDQQHHRLTL